MLANRRLKARRYEVKEHFVKKVVTGHFRTTTQTQK